MLGTLVIYDGILTFKDFLNDPTGKWLDQENVQSYKDSFQRLETIGRSAQFSGNFTPWVIDKFARLMSRTSANKDPIVSNVAPSLNWLWDITTGLSPVPLDGNYGSVWSNLAQDDPEGATVQLLQRLPLGKEYLAYREGIGQPLVDRRDRRAKGGVVKNVPQVPEEPDERIDKMTGLPYNIQAGSAFIDNEDVEARTPFVFGGVAKILKPAFFKPSSFSLQHLFKKGADIKDRWASPESLENLKPSRRKNPPTKASEVSPEVPSSAGKDLERLQAKD